MGPREPLLAGRHMSALETPCLECRGPTQSKGYGCPTFDGRQVLLHRHIVETAEGRPLEPGEVVMHLCDNPPCFRYDHLRRATQSENITDAVRKGRHRFGRGRWKMTPEAAEEIRRRSLAGESRTDLAREFGCSPCHVSNIKAGRKWPKK
jgi:hypothetical protein